MGDMSRIPYQTGPRLREWINDLIYELVKTSSIDHFDEDRLKKELIEFSEQVIRAAREGHFKEVS